MTFLRTVAWMLTTCIVTNATTTSAVGHEGHKPLPTRGMEVDVDKGSMILTRAARETLDVQSEEVASQAIISSLHAYGSIVAPWDHHAVIASPLPGRITSLLARPGETVSEGQVLAELESPQLDELQWELKSAQVDVLLADKLVTLLEESSRSGAVPGNRLVEAKSQQERSIAAVENASAKWRSLRLSESSLSAILQNPQSVGRQLLELRSPIAGVVTHADLSVGKVVDPKEHLLEIFDLSSVWLRIGILEKDLAEVTQGQTVEMTLTSFPDHRFLGMIDVVDSYLDPATHLGIVWTTLQNTNKDAPKLFPGMSGRVQIQSQSPKESITVPFAAVIRDGAERFVLVEQERTEVASTYKKQTVALGKRDGELIEVRGGELYPGDRVVTRGSHELGGFFAKGVLTVSTETARDIGLVVAKPETQSISKTISIDGVIDVPPTQRSVAAVQLGGAIERILVDRGQKVSRGQWLALINSQPFQDLQLELLKADVETRLNQSIVNSLRSATDAIAQRQLWEAESKLIQFTSRRNGLIQQLRTVGLDAVQIESLLQTKELVLALPVRAPIDGVIVGFDKFLGHVVQPDEPLFEVHDLSQAWVKGFISERDLASVQVGQQVRVRFVASPNEVIAGTVARSGQAVSEVDRTLSIWIELKQMPTFALQHNMLARITIETGGSEPGLAVPHEAIIREGTRAYVFVEQDDKTFERRFITTGNSDDRSVFVLAGLSSGEAIATRGAAALQSGYAALK